MEDSSSPGRRQSPDGKPSRRSLNPLSHKGRKLPSPEKKEVVLRPNENGSKERIDMDYDPNEEDHEIPTKDFGQELDSSITSPSKTGVAYITENMIKRLTHEEHLGNITKLYLILGKDLNKKFRYLENLENLPRLQILHISNHMIEKIEKLDKLTQLRELNLSRNNIIKIEGLESLVRLQKLNLSGNKITQLPGGLMRKLKELQVFHVAHNKIESLLEITKLRSLQDLTEVSIEGNPVSTLAHSRQFVIFQLRSLTVLDGSEVKQDERVVADDQFGQDEIRRLEAELSRQENLYDTLFEEKRVVCSELEMLTRLSSQQKEKDSRQTEKIKILQRELESKEEILASKTTELSKACEKQYKLEQELAFYKLDAKFDHLGKIPWPEGAEFGDEEDDEAPYIGKAGFKPNKFAHDSHAVSPAQQAQMTELKARLSDRYDSQNKKTQDEIHQALTMDLRQKDLEVQRAEEQLRKLEEELRRRKAQLADTNDELALLQEAIGEEIKLLSDEEKRLLAAIEDKKKFIRELQDVAGDLEERLNKIHDDLRRKEEELTNLNNALNSTSPDDPAYEQLKTRLAALQDQLRNTLKEYDHLKKDHERTLRTLEDEMAELQRLQDELAAKRKEADGQGKLKEELKDIIDELNAHLDSMRKKVEQQQKKIAQLHRDNEGLAKQLRDQQAQIVENNQLKNGIAKLQQQLQDAFNREKANADALRRRLSELEGQEAKGSSLEPLLVDAKARLKATEAEAENLRNALEQMKQQMKLDRQAADERIRREQEKVEKALQAAKAGYEKERQMKDLGIQVDTLKAKNNELEQRLKELENDLKNSFDKDEVLDRLADLKDDVDTQRDAVRQPLGHGDELGETLGDLHQRYLDLLGALKKEKQGEKVDKNKVDGQIKDLNARIENLQNALKQADDRAKQMEAEIEAKEDVIHKLEGDMKRLKDNMARQEDLQNELARLRDAHEREVKGLLDEIAKLKDRIKQLKNSMEREVSNARAPLEDKIHDLEDRLDHLHDRLAKAKAEADRLKGLQSDHAAAKRNLEDEIASLADALQDANDRAQHAEDQRANDRRFYQAKIKNLEDELERANERLQRLMADNDNELEEERQANADKVRGLQDEMERLKDQLRRMRQKASDDAAKNRELEAQRARQMEDELAALQDQLQKARIMGDDQLGKAERRNAVLQTLLDQQNQALEENARRDLAHQARVQGLQDQIDELKKMLKDAENKLLKDKYEKDLDALRADQRQMAAQAAAAKELADAQKQIARLQAFLAGKDQQLQEQLKKGLRDDPLIASQRGEISNLASALSQQHSELERLKQDLSHLRRPIVGYSLPGLNGPTFPTLADEIEALRAALHDRERQVEALTQGYHVGAIPGHMTGASERTGVATSPGGLASGLVNSQGEVHHHHHFKKSGRGGTRSKVAIVPYNELPTSPTVLGASVVSPGAYGASVHHHHYDGLPEDKHKRRKKKDKLDDLFCNVAAHGDLEYEVGLLEGMLTSTKQQSTQDQRDSLRSDLQNLEDEVQGALRSRAVSRRNQQHSLDATLASLNDQGVPVQTQTDSQVYVHTGNAIPVHYLQPSETRVNEVDHQEFPAQVPSQPDLKARRDCQLSELTHIDSLLRKRRMELQEVTANLSDRRQELDNVTDQCKRGEDRLRRVEDDANHIEHRASETSSELIRAGNQLLNLELRSRTMTDKLEHLDLEIEAKTKSLSETEKKYCEVKERMEKINKEMGRKQGEIHKTEKKLEEVQERLKLSLRLEELREIISNTEKDEHLKKERRLSALKDGEKILDERTSQLAKTRNELLKQTTEYHELNANITRARKDLKQLEIAVKKKNIEIEDLAARKEEERAYHESLLEEAKDKLEEINEARNEVLAALRKHREELLTIREKVQEENEKKTQTEKERNEKQEYLNRLKLQAEEKEKYLANLKNSLNENLEEFERLRNETEEERLTKNKMIKEVMKIKQECEQLLENKEKTKENIKNMMEKIESLQSDLHSKEQCAADTMLRVEQAQKKLDETTDESLAALNKRNSLLEELKELNHAFEERTKELETVTEEKNKVFDELQQERQKFVATKESYQEFEGELKNLRKELEKRQEELKKELETEVGEPAVRDVSGKGDLLILRDEFKKKKEELKKELEGEKIVEAGVSDVSSKESVTRRRRRHGAMLPIPTKSLGPRDQKEPMIKNHVNRDSKTARNAPNAINTANTDTESQALTLSRHHKKKSEDDLIEEAGSSRDEERFISNHDASVAQLQTRIVELSAEKDRTRQALKNSVLEVKRLKAQIQTEKEKAKHSLGKATAEARDYRRALEHVQKEHAQYQERASHDLEYFRAEAAEHYQTAQKLAQEITFYKKATVHEEESKEKAESTSPLRGDNRDNITTQIKTEILQSLRDVEQSREMTIKDIEDLRQTKEVIEQQLTALQQSLKEVTEKTLDLQKNKNETSEKQIEESSKQQKDKTFVRQQGYLKDQLRQQMSRRAELLEEERKKAGQSLEGLKNKLKQLEKVITRKDSAVQDFRLELAKSRIEKEKSVDMEKEMEDLKRRLQDVENERDTVKTQLSHFAALGEHSGPVDISKRYENLQKKLDNITSKLGFIEITRDEEDERSCSYPFAHFLSRGRPNSENKRSKGGRHLYKNKYSKKLRENKEQSFAESDKDAGENVTLLSYHLSRPTVADSDDEKPQASVSERHPITLTSNEGEPSYVSTSMNSDGSEEDNIQKKSSSWRVSRERPRGNVSGTRDQEDSPETGKLLRDKRKTCLARDREHRPNCGVLSTSKKMKETSKKNESYAGSGFEFEAVSKSGLLTISSMADDKRTKFLASVNRLKNEKVRELEVGLQQFLKH